MTSGKNYGCRDVTVLLKAHREISIVAYMVAKKIRGVRTPMWLDSTHDTKVFSKIINGSGISSIVNESKYWRKWEPRWVGQSSWTGAFFTNPYNNRIAQIRLYIVNSSTQEIVELRSGRDGNINISRIYHAIKKLLKD